MNLKIYQSFFLPEQFALLDKAFIPYSNIENKFPWQREYPLIVDLYTKNRGYDGYWGMMSWLFTEKTKITGTKFKQLIEQNPGYDVYHFNTVPNMSDNHINPFMQGDEYHHQGIADYTNNLMRVLGYKDFDIKKIKFDPEHFVLCSYYVGNSRFWDHWIVFLTTCVYVSQTNPELDSYLSDNTSIHNGLHRFPNFPFVIERLIGLFLHLNIDIYKTKCFTFDRE